MKLFTSKLVVFLVIGAALASTVTVAQANSLIRTQMQAPRPTMTLNPTSGLAGTVVTVTGSGWPPNTVVDIRFHSTQVSIVKPTADSNGTFTATFTVPPGAVLGPNTVDADDETTHQSTKAIFTVTQPTTPTPSPSPTISPTSSPSPITIATACPNQTPVVSSLTQGDQVSIVAVLNSTKKQDGSQEAEGDTEPTLHLFDTNGQLATQAEPLVVSLNETKSFDFIATAGDQVDACIDRYDGDKTGKVNVTVNIGPMLDRQLAKLISDILLSPSNLPDHGGPALTIIDGIVIGICTVSGRVLIAPKAIEHLDIVDFEKECKSRLEMIFSGQCNGLRNAFHCLIDFAQAHRQDILKILEMIVRKGKR